MPLENSRTHITMLSSIICMLRMIGMVDGLNMKAEEESISTHRVKKMKILKHLGLAAEAGADVVVEVDLIAVMLLLAQTLLVL